MKKYTFILALIVVVLVVAAVIWLPKSETSTSEVSESLSSTEVEVVDEIEASPLDVITEALVSDEDPVKYTIEEVPYIPETPDGVWEGPWKNGCEEASIAMVEFYYTDNTDASVDEIKTFMMRLFDIEDELWGQNANSDAHQTAELINGYTSFSAEIVDNPTIEDIKAELLANRPVISLNNGFILDNPRIPFLATGSGYHMMVIVGYDDVTDRFVVHDDGDLEKGEFLKYGYDHFMSTLHDYNDVNKKTDGPPRVLFTSPN